MPAGLAVALILGMGTLLISIPGMLFDLKMRHLKRRQKCLASIERLEHELFPEWFTSLGVDHHGNHVELRNPYGRHKAAVEREYYYNQGE